jgi:hypothetical protein
MPAKSAPPAIAFSADGARFVAYFPSADFHTLLTWDVRTGTLRDALTLPNTLNTGLKGRCQVQWTGPRHVLLNEAHLVDLDFGAVVWAHGAGPNTHGAPDDRVWQIGAGQSDTDRRAEVIDRMKKRVKELGDPAAAIKCDEPYFFYASRLPYPALAARIDALRDKPILSRNRPIRVEIACESDEYRDKLGIDLSRLLSSSGFTSDPKASAAIRLVVDRPVAERFFAGTRFEVVQGGQVIREGSSGGMPAYAVIRSKVQIVDGSGRVIWTRPGGAGAAQFAEAGEADAAMKAAKSADEIQAKYPKAMTEARKEFAFQSNQVVGSTAILSVIEKPGAIVFDGDQRLILPLRSYGLPLEGVVEGRLVPPPPQ